MSYSRRLISEIILPTGKLRPLADENKIQPEFHRTFVVVAAIPKKNRRKDQVTALKLSRKYLLLVSWTAKYTAIEIVGQAPRFKYFAKFALIAAGNDHPVTVWQRRSELAKTVRNATGEQPVTNSLRVSRK